MYVVEVWGGEEEEEMYYEGEREVRGSGKRPSSLSLRRSSGGWVFRERDRPTNATIEFLNGRRCWTAVLMGEREERGGRERASE